jgi:transcriptional regulator with XRE-family HTH domain
MAAKNPLANALRRVRKARNLSQEAFSDVSSRTYLSSLERGLKSPTLGKIDALCSVLSIHPMTLLALVYGGTKTSDIDALFQRVRRELVSLDSVR